jgi:hypothetical protein
MPQHTLRWVLSKTLRTAATGQIAPLALSSLQVLLFAAPDVRRDCLALLSAVGHAFPRFVFNDPLNGTTA